jgi:hypothetical protein
MREGSNPSDLRPPPANHTIPQKATDVSICAFGAERVFDGFG